MTKKRARFWLFLMPKQSMHSHTLILSLGTQQTHLNYNLFLQESYNDKDTREEKESFVIKDIVGKGKGMFSTRRIYPG